MSNGLLNNMLIETVMERAIRDKIVLQQAEQRKQEALEKRKEQVEECDEDQDEDLKEMFREMKAARLRELQAEVKQKEKQSKGIGEYREIVEEEFLNSVTKSDFVVVHFYHQDFERCKIMDKHLQLVAQQYVYINIRHPETKFFYLNAEKAPFFVQKLQVKMLPTLCLFKQGILKDRIIGFDQLGAKDNFDTILLVRLLAKYNMIKIKKNQSDSESDEDN